MQNKIFGKIPDIGVNHEISVSNFLKLQALSENNRSLKGALEGCLIKWLGPYRAHRPGPVNESIGGDIGIKLLENNSDVIFEVNFLLPWVWNIDNHKNPPYLSLTMRIYPNFWRSYTNFRATYVYLGFELSMGATKTAEIMSFFGLW